jgi:hypothetical protein
MRRPPFGGRVTRRILPDEPHPGDALAAELLDVVPEATLVADDGFDRWQTIAEERYGALQIRDVPEDDHPPAEAEGAS